MALAESVDSDPLLTDEDVLGRARSLVDRGLRRQLWLLLLDEDGRQVPILPRIDIPTRPHPGDETRFAARLGEIAEEADAATIAVIYERPGPERLTPDDRRWLRLLSVRGDGVAVRGPLLAHGRGVRWVGPEDLDDPGASVDS